MKKKVREMEEEAARIEALQASVEKAATPTAKVAGNTQEADSRSVYVGNVDYSTTIEELKEFFQSCGPVTRVTICTDKWTQQPKGYGYVEFKEADALVNAMILN